MDDKRLEEIRQWAHDQAIEQTIDGSSVDADYFRDLARCAAAWAKVERILTTDTDIELARCYGGEIRIRLNDVNSTEWGRTAIAAVEAAPEVKP